MWRPNPDYPYLPEQIASRLSMENAIIRVAKRDGQEDSPRAIQAVENIKILEGIRHDRAS